MVNRLKPYIKLQSSPGAKRVGSRVLWAAIFIGFAFMALWTVVAICAFSYSPLWSMIILLAVLAFSAFLGSLASTLYRDSFRSYILELTDQEAVLEIVDGSSKKKAVQMVLLQDIKYAEYYPYCDSASVIFHTDYTRMEVPLWPLGDRAEDVLAFLDGRGVPVINVQSDEPVPGVTANSR